jgi:hypothetical protein
VEKLTGEWRKYQGRGEFNRGLEKVTGEWRI